MKILCDLSGDGDYDDTDENVSFGAFGLGAVTESASDAVRVLGGQGVFLGPVR